MSPLPQKPSSGDNSKPVVPPTNKSKLSIQPPSFTKPPTFSKPSAVVKPSSPREPEAVVVDEPVVAEREVVTSPPTPAPAFVEPTESSLPVSEIEIDNVSVQGNIEPEQTIEELSPEDEEEAQRIKLIDALSPSAKENARKLLDRIMDDKCSEVLMNGPDKIMVKQQGNRLLLNDIKFDSIEEYHTVIDTLILAETDTPYRIRTGNRYLIEGQLELYDNHDENALPLFARVHVLTPPVVKAAKATIAKKAKQQFRIDDLVSKGAMTPQMGMFLKALSKGKATIVFSGLSGAGKTTLLEACSYEFDENDRIIVVEDTAELRLPVYDVVSLLSTSRKPGQDSSDVVSLEWLVAQANRMRPDRIIVGESRGGEFAEFLTAANSGADGSMTTIHASSTKQAIDKMRSLALKSGTTKNEASVLRDISSTVQIIVQMGLIDGLHVITQIDEISDVVTANNTVPIQPIFAYDRSTGSFKTVGKPSEKLVAFLAGRGVTIDPTWFQRVAR